jgi:beta-glucosidase
MSLFRRLLLTVAAIALAPAAMAAPVQPALGSRSGATITVDGLKFRDLDRDGKLSPYEDWRLDPDRRAADLTARMTLDEKAGAMMHGTVPAKGPLGVAGIGAGYDLDKAAPLIQSRHVETFITRLSGGPAMLAEQNNALQALAEDTRLGIPVTISTDPRNHFQFTAGAS